MNQHSDRITIPESAKQHWELISALSKGGQGSTFKVQNKFSGQLGVLKILNENENKTAIKRFKREVSVVLGLNHSGIIKIQDSNLDDLNPWYVTELGEPLRDFWNKQPVTARFALGLKFVTELCDVLAIIHGSESPVVHRDIKPENIVIINGRATLIDFGLAIRPSEDERLSHSRSVGNRLLAPSAAYHGIVEEVTPWWDCFCLAGLFAWMVASDLRIRGPLHWKYVPYI